MAPKYTKKKANNKNKKLKELNPVDDSEIMPSTSSALTDNEKNEKSFDDLNPDIIRHIIKFVPGPIFWGQLLALRTLNKLFRDLIDEFLATKKGVSYNGTIAQYGGYIHLDFKRFDPLMSYFPNVRHLKFNQFQIPEDFAQQLHKLAPQIVGLNFNCCSHFHASIAQNIVKLFPDLTLVKITQCDITEETLGTIVNLSKLQTLDVLNTGPAIMGTCLENLGPHIRHICFSVDQRNRTEEVIIALTEGNGRFLTELGIRTSDYHTTNWETLTTALKFIRKFRLQFASSHADTLIHFAEFEQLEELALAEWSNNPNQSVLDDDSLVPLLERVPRLTSLILAGKFAQTCKFTDLSMFTLTEFCPNLTEVILIKTNYVSDDTLIAFARYLVNLKKVVLQEIISLTNRGVNLLALTSLSMKHLSIKDCPQITEGVITAWGAVADSRSREWIYLCLEGVRVERELRSLPKNLKISIK